ncbi:MAG: GTPase, partial [Candidatus Micrarchaeia archaeon]
MKRKKVLILGAAGRDFHNFNVFFKNKKEYEVVGFTSTQIPGIENRIYPKELAGRFYKKGIKIYDELKLEELIERKKVDVVVFSYSDVSYDHVMEIASKVLSKGSDFWLLGPKSTMVKSKKPVIAVTAVRTGSGKSSIVAKIAEILRKYGEVAIIRHPMPYGNLRVQDFQVFKSEKDLKDASIEEREEIEFHLRNGNEVITGFDMKKVLKYSEKKDFIIWDGGNNDFPFIKPSVWITVVD